MKSQNDVHTVAKGRSMAAASLPSQISDMILSSDGAAVSVPGAETRVAEVHSTLESTVQAGTVVVLDIEDLLTYVMAILHCLTHNAIPAIVDPRLSPRLRSKFVDSVRPQAELFQRGTGGLQTRLCNHPLRTDLGGVGLVQMTSGTTGSPVLVRRYVDDVLHELDAFLSLPHLQDEIDTLVMTASPFHTFCLYGAVLPGVLRGKNLVWKRSFQTDTTSPLWAARAESAAMLTVPTLIGVALDRPTVFPVERLGALVVAGERLSRASAERLRAANPRTLNNMGTTESGMIGVSRGDDLTWLTPTRSGHVRVDDGRLNVRITGNPYVGTESDRYAGGFLYTGDLVEDRGKDFRILGRSDSRVSVHGVKVSLSHIEDVAMSLPGVKAAVATFNQYITLHVETEPGTSEDQVRGGLVNNLESTEMPRSIMCGDQLPRTELGKLSRDPRRFREGR